MQITGMKEFKWIWFPAVSVCGFVISLVIQMEKYYKAIYE